MNRPIRLPSSVWLELTRIAGVMRMPPELVLESLVNCRYVQLSECDLVPNDLPPLAVPLEVNDFGRLSEDATQRMFPRAAS